MKTLPYLATNLLALALLSAASVRAASVPITNGTFDARNNTANSGGNLSLNQYTILYGVGVTVFDALNNSAIGTADVPGFINVGNNYDGIQFLDPSMFFGQGGAPTTQPGGNITLDNDVPNKAIATSADNVLSNTSVVPNSTYTLTLDLNKFLGSPLPDTFQMQLFAGGVDLGGTLTVVLPTDTQPGSATLVVTTGATVNGGALSCQLSASASMISNLRQIAFDNLALDVASNSPLTLTAAVSRQTQGSAGSFDIELPADRSGVECRSTGGNYKFVFTFSNNVVSGNATLDAPAGGSLAGSPVFSGNTMTVNLTGVANAQVVTVTLSGVTDSSSQMPDTDVSGIILIADVTANKTVDFPDYSFVKANRGAAVTDDNFRADINGDGVINRSDARIVRANRHVTLPP